MEDAMRSQIAAPTEPMPARAAAPAIGLEQYYEEAGPDYAAWSQAFNMHFGYFRRGANPFAREAMLEQMNAEVLTRLAVEKIAAPRLLDLGCGLGATMRSIARRRSDATITGITRVPWQVARAAERNAAAGCGDRVRVLEGDYQDTILPREQYHGLYAVESACHGRGTDKAEFLAEAYRLLRPGGRLVVADGFLNAPGFRGALQQRLYRKLCTCWVIEELAQVQPFVQAMARVGFVDIVAEPLQWRVAPSVAHVPWVTLKFLVTQALAGDGRMTRARWNNVLAPILLPWVSAPLGPMSYYIISATRPARPGAK